MLCRAGSCGRAATLHVCVDKRPVASACSQACAEQIRAQLIGAPERAANDHREAQRFRDLRTLLQWIYYLVDIRANLHMITPLEVSTATMHIGDQIDSRAMIATQIDAILRRGIELQANILANVEYDINEIRVRIRGLRDAIANKTMVDKFERLYMDTSDATHFDEIPGEIRHLIAARADPIQKIAEFTVGHDLKRIWAYEGRLRAGGVEYRYDGTRITDPLLKNAPGVVNSFGQTIATMEPHGYWAVAPTLGMPYIPIDRYGLVPVNHRDKIAHSSDPTKLYSFSMETFDHNARDFHLFSAGKSIIGGIAMSYLGDENKRLRVLTMSINHDTGVIDVDLGMEGSSKGWSENSIALDSFGNFWAANSHNATCTVYTPDMQKVIATISGIEIMSICTADDGVWIMHIRGGQFHCANYRLAPSTTYNLGLGPA